MSTQIGRPRWATYNTPNQDRHKAKRRDRKARRALQELIDQAATLTAPPERNAMSQTRDDNYWSDDAMEARQEARRQLIARCGSPKPRQTAQRPPTEREERLAAGFIFSDRAEQVEASKAEHQARRRRADAELAGRERIHSSLRDRHGLDFADQWMDGGDAA
ncbi:hypothetical protein ACFV14_10775 [Streptomyces zaomyceticus]|uniref:hypothetical protein n=1 Tax=Streptomyces zaomyceticus TaxID=68286 RepID=UPI00368635FB